MVLPALLPRLVRPKRTATRAQKSRERAHVRESARSIAAAASAAAAAAAKAKVFPNHFYSQRNAKINSSGSSNNYNNSKECKHAQVAIERESRRERGSKEFCIVAQ